MEINAVRPWQGEGSLRIDDSDGLVLRKILQGALGHDTNGIQEEIP